MALTSRHSTHTHRPFPSPCSARDLEAVALFGDLQQRAPCQSVVLFCPSSLLLVEEDSPLDVGSDIPLDVEGGNIGDGGRPYRTGAPKMGLDGYSGDA